MSRREFLSKHPRIFMRPISFVHLSAMVLGGIITGALPDWLIKAQRLEADAADLADAQQSLREAMQ